MKEKTALKICESALYFLAALVFYLLVNLWASATSVPFGDFARALPFGLFLADSVYFLFALHLLTHPLNETKRIKTAEVNGALLLILSFVGILSQAVYYRLGYQPSWISGGITPFYPLDGFIGHFALLILGSGLYLFSRYLRKHHRNYEWSVHEWQGHEKIWTSIFRPFFALIALYFMGSLLLAPFRINAFAEHAGSLVGFFLLMLLPSVMLAFYEWDYLDKEPLPQRQRLYRNSVILTLAGLILALWYWLAQALDPRFLSESLIALFPWDFMLQVKIAPYLLLLSCLGSSLIAFLHYLNRSVLKKPKNA
jgi:hypothetical protein